MARECPRAARIEEWESPADRRFERGPILVCEGPALYRPRRPERTPFYRLIDEHFTEFARVHEERFEPEDGPLRRVVKDAVAAFLDCGVPRGGFARVRCPACHAEVLLCFSCRTRFFCPSCQQKRAELLAEKLRQDVLAPVAHRHVVFTIPKVLRPTFFRERRLLGLLPRCAFRALSGCLRAALGRTDGVPGFVASIQTFGSAANCNPHVHALVSDGLLLPGGEFVAGPPWDDAFEGKLTERFRRLVLRALRKEERLSEGFHEKLLTFAHGGGFSVYAKFRVMRSRSIAALICRHLAR